MTRSSTTAAIELCIQHHQSGRYTLTHRQVGDHVWADYVSSPLNLFGNPDKADFMVNVYIKIKEFLDEGRDVVLHDFPEYIES